jgi:hypothetical protein
LIKPAVGYLNRSQIEIWDNPDLITHNSHKPGRPISKELSDVQMGQSFDNIKTKV